MDVTKHHDPRRESYRLNPDTIEIVGSPLPTAREWEARLAIIEPLRSHCLCCLSAERDANKFFPTLGFFRADKIARLRIEPDDEAWSPEELMKLSQVPLMGPVPKTRLEKIPYRFIYEFSCPHDTCRGHNLSCADWEVAQSYRNWRRRYGDRWEAKFRETYERDMVEKFDTQFFVGTVARHPDRWIIVGLFYPPRRIGEPATQIGMRL